MKIEIIFGGIDPGKTGCIVFLNELGDILAHHSAPLIGKDYDKQHIVTIFKAYNNFNLYCVLEDVHALNMGGKVSNFDFGRGKGIYEGILMALKISHSLITPKRWQKEVWTAKKQYKPNKKRPTIDTKAMSLITAKMLQPDWDWANISPKTGAKLSTIDDGFVDAYLIAEYARRTHQNIGIVK